MQRILIVDGSRAVRRILEKRLSRLSCEVVLASSSNQALAKLRRKSFSLISTAVALPDENGLQFVKDARRYPGVKDIPIVVITGNEALPPDAQQSYGIDAMVEKSAGIQMLIDIINQKLLNAPEVEEDDYTSGWTEYDLQMIS